MKTADSIVQVSLNSLRIVRAEIKNTARATLTIKGVFNKGRTTVIIASKWRIWRIRELMTKIFPEYGKVAKCRLVGCSFGDKTELRRPTSR